MWLHFDRSGRYAGRSQRLTLGEVLVLPFVLLLVLMLLLLPFLWPLAVFGGGVLGWTITVAWNVFLGAMFVLVLGRPPRHRREPRHVVGAPGEPVTPTTTDGPRDWHPLDGWHDDGRRLV